MKFISLLSACALTLSLGSCNNQADKPTVIEKTEVIKVEVEAPKEEEKKSTSVTIGPDGSSLKSTEIDVEIKK
jgi:hypothetical protein